VPRCGGGLEIWADYAGGGIKDGLKINGSVFQVVVAWKQKAQKSGKETFGGKGFFTEFRLMGGLYQGW
jgi:hypothetical protein